MKVTRHRRAHLSPPPCAAQRLNVPARATRLHPPYSQRLPPPCRAQSSLGPEAADLVRLGMGLGLGVGMGLGLGLGFSG